MSAAVVGAMVGTALVLSGVFLVVLGFSPGDAPTSAPKGRGRWNYSIEKPVLAKILIGAGIGLVGAIITGWVILVAIVPVAVIVLPYLFGAGDQSEVKKLDAIDEWTRTLAGVLAAGNALEDGIINTARSTPEAIRPQVTNLIARLRSRMSTVEALRLFANELGDTTCDKIVCALLLGAQRRSVGLAPILYDLADSVAEDVAARRMVLAERAKQTQTSRLVTIITVIVFGGFLLLGGSYVASYGTPLGQLILAILLGAYVGDLFWLKSSTKGKALPRILGPEARR